MKVVAVGNPFDGIELYGPFIAGDDIDAFCDTANDDWWIMSVSPPSGISEDGLLKALRTLDGPLFRAQREWLSEQEDEYARGLSCLLDEIADYAHDYLGVDCLLEEEAE